MHACMDVRTRKTFRKGAASYPLHIIHNLPRGLDVPVFLTLHSLSLVCQQFSRAHSPLHSLWGGGRPAHKLQPTQIALDPRTWNTKIRDRPSLRPEGGRTDQSRGLLMPRPRAEHVATITETQQDSPCHKKQKKNCCASAAVYRTPARVPDTDKASTTATISPQKKKRQKNETAKRSN